LQANPKPYGLGRLNPTSTTRVLMVFAASVMFTLASTRIPGRMSSTIVFGLAIGVAMMTMLTIGSKAPVTTTAAGEVAFSLGGLASSLGSARILAASVCGTLSSMISGRHRQPTTMRLGQYTLEEKIGEGGMGTVYRARHAMLRRPTAVKLLRSERVGEEAIERFEREVQLTSQLTHPNTITIYDYGRTPDGVFYYAMEHLDGATLQTVVEQTGPQPAARVVHVLRMIAGALGEAHGRGLIHRDIKPANIVLGERGGMLDVATVLDFGLVREMAGDRDAALTYDGRIVGTPMYLAPEVIRANAADARSDIYALGAVAYFLLTGRTVFEGKSVVEVCSHHLHSSVVPPSRRIGNLSGDLEALILQCLAKDPAARPQTMAALIEALDALDVPKWTSEQARAWAVPHETKRARALRHERSGISSTMLAAGLSDVRHDTSSLDDLAARRFRGALVRAV
jgi:eukaryotic-like serine/threonine-protein kinase